MLGKKPLFNAINLELSNAFDFQLITCLVFMVLYFIMLNIDKQTFFEIHHCL